MSRPLAPGRVRQVGKLYGIIRRLPEPWQANMLKNRRILPFFLVLVLATGPAIAQEPPAKPDAPTPTPASADPSSAYRIEAKRMRVRMEADGRGSRELSMRVRVLDTLGVRQWGQIPLTYASESDDLEIREFEVRKANGSVVKVGPESVQELTPNQQGPAPVFLDLRQRHVTVPSLQPGDTVVFTVAWIVARPLIANQSWFDYSFTKTEIIEDEQLELDVPASLSPTIRPGPAAPPEASGGTGRLVGDRRIFVWRTSNLTVESADPEEDANPLDDAPVPDVRVTTFRNWTAFAGWLGPLMRPSADAAVNAKAAELTKGLTDQDAKIRALYAYVSTEIRYVSLSFGIGRFAPHSPAEVLKNQYGDCKDKHALLSAMLETIGVHAVPVLVNTTRSVSADLPSPSEFDHVVTAIPRGADPSQWIWLDATLEVAPFGLLDAGSRDRLAFSLGTRSVAAAMVKTPADPPFESVQTMTVDGDVNGYGVLVANVRLAVRGDIELVLRSVARVAPRESMKQAGDEFVKSLGFKGEVSNFAFSDPLASDKPFEVTFTLRQGGYLDWAAKSSTLPDVSGRLDVSALDGQTHPLKKDKKVGSPSRIRRTVTLRMPVGYAMTAPTPVKSSAGTIQYSSDYVVSGNVLTVRREFTGQPRTLLASESGEYTRLARAIVADIAQGFAVTKDRPRRPSVPSDMTAGELYHAGYSAYMAREYDAALMLWMRSTELDPKLANAWNGVGLAAQQFRRYEEAIAAFEKHIALEPSSKRAHRDLAAVLERAGESDRAAKAYARHVELNPSDGSAYKALGEIYKDLDRHDEAVAAFDRAASLLRDDEWIPILLGEVHLARKDATRAIGAFDRALGMSKHPAVLTKVGWELANHGGYDQRALELLDRATADIAATISGLTASMVQAEHFDLMERLAWGWDGRGLIALRKGDTEGAVRYFEAAWRLGGESVMAEHLGMAYERMKNRSSDALNAYLLARSVTNDPSESLLAHIKRVGGAHDLEPFLRVAQAEFLRQRGHTIDKQWPEGRAEFVAILDGKGRPLATEMRSGPDAFRTAIERVSGLTMPLTAPDERTNRIVVKLLVACGPEGPVCGVIMSPAGAAAQLSEQVTGSGHNQK